MDVAHDVIYSSNDFTLTKTHLKVNGRVFALDSIQKIEAVSEYPPRVHRAWGVAAWSLLVLIGGWLLAAIIGVYVGPDLEKIVSALSTLTAAIMFISAVGMSYTTGEYFGYYIQTGLGRELLFHTKNQAVIERMGALAKSLPIQQNITGSN